MILKDFEAKIKGLDERFSVFENANRPGLANVFFDGKNYDLPVVSSRDIKDVPDRTHTYEFPNGQVARLWSLEEIMPRLEGFLNNFKEGKFDGIFEE